MSSLKMKLITFLVIFLWSSALSSPIRDDGGEGIIVPEDWGLNIYQFLDKYHYGYEAHSVVTEDGYILGLQRITTRRNGSKEEGIIKPVVLLMHGLECSAMDFVNNGPNSALGLMLADRGYDVWLGNNRGNTWSENHTSLTVKDKEFWNFSFHEMGKYDLSALIDHILINSGQKQLTYVGHSQGTTVFFALAATRPEYNEKVKLMVALAPVAYMKEMTHPLIRFLAEPTHNLAIGFGIETSKLFNIVPHWDIITQLGKYICSDNSPGQQLCADIFNFMGGYNPPQQNKTFLPVIVSSAPAGTSYKQILHYIQEIRSGYFRQFDYGLVENRKIYNQLTPPVYDVKKITAPVALFYSQNDLFAAASDVDRLGNELPNLVKKQKIALEDFTHLDFLWAIDINFYVNNDVIDLIVEYNKVN